MRSTVFGAVLALAVPSLASAQDQSTSDFPWVSFVAGSSGTYMINFTMCDCATDICHMAMQVMNCEESGGLYPAGSRWSYSTLFMERLILKAHLLGP